MCLYLASSSLCWASRLRLLLLSWECLSNSSSSSTSWRCCSAVIRSWSRLRASVLDTESSRSRAHTLASASRAAHRASLSLERASAAECWELSDAWSTCVCKSFLTVFKIWFEMFSYIYEPFNAYCSTHGMLGPCRTFMYVNCTTVINM